MNELQKKALQLGFDKLEHAENVLQRFKWWKELCRQNNKHKFGHAKGSVKSICDKYNVNFDEVHFFYKKHLE